MLTNYLILLQASDENKTLLRKDDSENDEIEDDLEKEKEALNSQADKNESERRFQVIESGIQNVLFVRTTVESPVALVEEIIKDISATNTQRSRHLIRLIPIQKTCKAFENPGNFYAT